MTTEIEGALTVRTMNRNDLDRALAWAAAEGWNPGTHDAPAFFAADPDGFFVAELAGEPVACVSAVRSGEQFGFLGLYIVRPEYRGRGFGLAVWAAGMAHLAGRNVGLDGVLAQVPNYERSGFRFAHHTTRYTGTGGGRSPADLVPLNAVPFESVAGYDAMCFPARRDAFLREWINLPESVALGATGPRGLTGYGVLRKSVNGYKVGPLFADDAETATRLLSGLAAAIPGEAFTIDVPDATAQPSGGTLVGRFGLTEVFRTARMYTGGAPGNGAVRVFGVTSLELG
ncbi:GNAT family N-acetyltransferase [Frigoriglobus tundricola]|uniref:Acetyltransferase, GNAT family n=1 Tax=Frigoriglobus tundricola TaxID=2774151 RepID=A0A6M5Z6U7_9BACT|nr:GNAT family N-acetyltransferase [Frigoriglobus tundricola]QJX01091.1 Acetyltransferase, GNAT family [Frigoriglobus tundricola]